MLRPVVVTAAVWATCTKQDAVYKEATREGGLFVCCASVEIRGIPRLAKKRARCRRSPPGVWWEPPASAGGAGLQSSGNAFYLSRMGFSPGFSRPALKRMIKVELFPATLKRCFPLLKQRAPTKLQGGSAAFRSSHADSLAPEVLLSCPVQTFSAACLVGAVKNGIGL